MDADSEFQLEVKPPPPRPQRVTNIYNVSGAQSPVNVQPSDHSVNVSTITENQVFARTRQAVTEGVPDEVEKRAILDKLTKLEGAINSEHVVRDIRSLLMRWRAT